MHSVRKWMAAAAMVAAGAANAGENGFGWIYTLDLQPKGTWEFEQKAWLQKSQSRGSYDYWQFKSELEYGVSADHQLGFYVNSSYVNAYRNGTTGETGGPGTDLPPGFDTSTRYRKLRVDSVAVESIWRLTNPYTAPIGIGLYLEPEIGPRTRELEARLLLQKNFLDDRLVVASNLTATSERERRSGEIERASALDASIGFTYRFANNMSAGLEYRNHREFTGYAFNHAEHSAHFLGPNFHYATKTWWATAAWRHQLPGTRTFNEEQRAETVGKRIYGDEHARNELIVKVGFPF